MSEDKNNQIRYAQINWSDQYGAISKQFDDIYFNSELKIDQTRYLLQQGNHLLKRWLDCKNDFFCIAESALGCAVNLLLTCQLFEQFLAENPANPLKRLIFTSFEKHPLRKIDLQRALQNAPELSAFTTPLLAQYPLALIGCHRIHINNVTIDLWLGDIFDTLPTLYQYQTGLFDIWCVNELSSANTSPTSKQKLLNLIVISSKQGASLLIPTTSETITSQLQAVGYHVSNLTKKNQPILVASLKKQVINTQYAQHFRPGKNTLSKEIAIIGGGISSACLSLALIKRGYQVTLYCKDKTLGFGASGNQQGALYPLLNKQHDALSQLFVNSFLYARNYVELINRSHPFAFDLSGLLQLYYDKSAGIKLDKILQADLPLNLVEKTTPQQTDNLANIDIGQYALHYPLAGWLSPTQMVKAVFDKAQQTGQLTINLNAQLNHFEETKDGWLCHFEKQSVTHPLLALTTAMHTLEFKQCEALPLSAARGQVTHIKSTAGVKKLKLTLCHEGYLTPSINNIHCMGATFKRHTMDQHFVEQEQIDNKNKLEKCITNKPWVHEIDALHLTESQNNANVGIRCTTRDHFPYMGALPDYQATKVFYAQADKKMPTKNAPFHNNLFILSGLGSRGLNTAPLLAETLASQINHEPLPLDMPILQAMQCNRQWVNYLKKGKTLKI